MVTGQDYLGTLCYHTFRHPGDELAVVRINRQFVIAQAQEHT